MGILNNISSFSKLIISLLICEVIGIVRLIFFNFILTSVDSMVKKNMIYLH